MAITEEGLARVITQAVALAVTQAMEAASSGARQGARGAGDAMHKFYTRIDKFSGDPASWKEWHYQFEVATSTYDLKTAEIMEKVQKMEVPEATTENIALELEDADTTWVNGTKMGLFGVLGMLTSGEANILVRSCEDKNGYTAWKKLYDRYNPKTPASLTAAWREVIRLKKSKDVREAGRIIDVWESKVATLKKEHGEEPTAGLKASLLLEMLPEGAQMTVLQGLNTKKLDYEALKAKIKMMANIQNDNATPKPMDIGEMKCDLEEVWDDYGNEESYGIDEVGGQTCHRCGGVGHYARECGTAKGKGKDQVKGKGKSAGKGWGDKGKGKGQYNDSGVKGGGKGKGCFNCGGNHFARECPKGNGKGGKGKGTTCYNCGGWGHRAAQCPSMVQAVEHEEADCGHEEGDGKIDNVRMISEVKMAGARQKFGNSLYARRATVGHPSCGKDDTERQAIVRQGINTFNRFEALIEEEIGEDEEYWIQEVAKDEAWKSVGPAEIVIDSAADESVCPKEWGKAFRTKAIPENEKIKLRSANGGKIEHFGEKVVSFKTGDQDDAKGMRFQVCDVQRPLAAVWRIVEQGNVVQFGPTAEDNYIWDPQTQEKIMMRRKGRSFVLDVDMVKRREEKVPFMRQA